jgi:hypothetical protein
MHSKPRSRAVGLSIWEYIRDRARDAVLAGIHDALDVAEQGDTNGSQHSAAEQFASRFIGLKQLLNTSVNGEQPEAEASTAADEVEAGLTEAPRSNTVQRRITMASRNFLCG